MSRIEDQVIAKIKDRAKVGKYKYGQTMERTDLSPLDWVRHLQEELMDASVYAERLAEEMGGWVSVEDVLPPIGELVWVVERDKTIRLATRYEAMGVWTWAIVRDGYFENQNGSITADAEIEDITPTHWHPLPKLPKL